MVPIFDFISPTFIYSFLEEKVQSSNNYLICVDFSLYAREINTKEISSVVLDCKCHLKIQPIGPVSLIPTGSVALSTSNTLWGKNQHCSQLPVGKLRLEETEECGWRITSLSCTLLQDRRIPRGSSGLSLTAISAAAQTAQRTGISACSSTQGFK